MGKFKFPSFNIKKLILIVVVACILSYVVFVIASINRKMAKRKATGNIESKDYLNHNRSQDDLGKFSFKSTELISTENDLIVDKFPKDDPKEIIEVQPKHRPVTVKQYKVQSDIPQNILRAVEKQKRLIEQGIVKTVDPNSTSYWCSKSQLKFFDPKVRKDVVGLVSAPGSGKLNITLSYVVNESIFKETLGCDICFNKLRGTQQAVSIQVTFFKPKIRILKFSL